jgi:hypothetical protein
MSKKMIGMLFTLLFTCLVFFGLGEFGLPHSVLMLSAPDTRLIIARVSVTLLLRFAQNLMLFFSWVHHKITSGQIHDSK